ncbi:carbohydrate esterase family 5 protein [Zasmidium cellare ATCC 36951]|uniref:Carbohydrate esterase family 5 protein n=1 Tax=Zasmidium cellare ATCC 36951 TaxID=1080233 RepID=A0A6A6C0Y7_ZASCE|nr:carbohydrate esterase family 5 protein [Zasmidium cellare ATCC 36951]KAF2159482.1 carbohydrate esterase family 5 protein [Zasmidium cellare ATCC 36951]
MLSSGLLSLFLATLSTAAPLAPRQITCASGLYIIVARGSNQAIGEGSPGEVANMIEALVADSYSVAVDYPAVIIDFDDNYFTSVVDGIEDTKAKIQDYVAACGASSRIALLGYSQGGNVVTDTLAGGTGKPDPIGEEYRANIVGAAVFGDPRFNAGQPVSAGDSTSDGIFARDSSLAALNTWSNVLRSYCDEGDPFCSSDFDLDVHYATVEKYAQAATDWIVSLAA